MREITLFLTTFFAALTFSSPALACTVAPPDIDKATQELQRMVLPALKLEEKNVQSVEPFESTADYVWVLSAMCPDGFSSSSKFTVSYSNDADPLTKGCTAEVKVSSYEDSYGKNEIKIEILEQGTCLESL